MRVSKRSTNFFTLIMADNKKSRHDDSYRNSFMTNIISRFEYLSNDLLYEIFEYLDAYEMLKAFSNLNNRFQRLIYHPSLRLKLHYDQRCSIPADDYCRQIILPNINRLISIHLKDENLMASFFNHDIFHQTCPFLESVILSELPLTQLQPILHHLRLAPRLHSLSIILSENSPSHIDIIYGLIFSFLHLKSLTIDVGIDWQEDDLMMSMPCSFNQHRFNSIRTLHIKHSLTYSGLQSLLQYTPELERLKCEKMVQPVRFRHRHRHLTLPHLKYIEIQNCLIDFFELEILIQHIGRAVETLKLNTGFDIEYLDGRRWEIFILKSMPNLKRFYFDVDEFSELDTLPLCKGIHQFHSAFWTERHWSTKLDINSKNIQFSIEPVRKQWFDMHRNVELESLMSSKCDLHNIIGTPTSKSPILIHLIADYDSDDDDNIGLLNEVQPFIGSFKFNQLTMKSSSSISIDLLMMMIDRSPLLDSLVLTFESSMDIDEDLVKFEKIETITKLKVNQPVHLELIKYLTKFFPKLEYFEIDCSSHLDMMTLARLILVKRIVRLPNLRSICFHIESADDKMIQMLRQWIYNETNIHLHTLKRIDKQIFVQWTS